MKVMLRNHSQHGSNETPNKDENRPDHAEHHFQGPKGRLGGDDVGGH